MGNCCLNLCCQSCLHTRRGYVNIETNKIDKTVPKVAPKTVQPIVSSTVSQAPAKAQPIMMNGPAETVGSKGGFFSKYDLREKEEIGEQASSRAACCLWRRRVVFGGERAPLTFLYLLFKCALISQLIYKWF